MLSLVLAQAGLKQDAKHQQPKQSVPELASLLPDMCLSWTVCRMAFNVKLLLQTSAARRPSQLVLIMHSGAQ